MRATTDTANLKLPYFVSPDDDVDGAAGDYEIELASMDLESGIASYKVFRPRGECIFGCEGMWELIVKDEGANPLKEDSIKIRLEPGAPHSLKMLPATIADLEATRETRSYVGEVRFAAHDKSGNPV